MINVWLVTLHVSIAMDPDVASVVLVMDLSMSLIRLLRTPVLLIRLENMRKEGRHDMLSGDRSERILRLLFTLLWLLL